MPCEEFPGLWVDGPALFPNDDARMTAALDRGLATSEHAEFARRLSTR